MEAQEKGRQEQTNEMKEQKRKVWKNDRDGQNKRIREQARNRAWCLAAVLLMCLLLPVMVSVTVLADTGREGRKTGKGTAPPEETVRSREEAPETDGSSQRKKPEVAAAIDGSLHREAEEGYYNAPRKATVTITDTEELFDEEAATAAIHISRDGKALEPGELVSKWSHDGDSHSAVIAFREDGRYTSHPTRTVRALSVRESVSRGMPCTVLRSTRRNRLPPIRGAGRYPGSAMEKRSGRNCTHIFLLGRGRGRGLRFMRKVRMRCHPYMR